MIAPSIAPSLADLLPAPTLADLHRELAHAERELVCADMGIDGVNRRRAEMERWTSRIAEIKAQIARIEEAF